MVTLEIHSIVKIEAIVNTYEVTDTHPHFVNTIIVITDKEGIKTKISLFSEKKIEIKMLKEE